jgi:hypothetical protein
MKPESALDFQLNGPHQKQQTIRSSQSNQMYGVLVFVLQSL